MTAATTGKTSRRFFLFPEKHVDVAQLFAAFTPTAHIDERGGLPEGWVHVHSFEIQEPGVTAAPYHLLCNEHLWALAFSTTDDDRTVWDRKLKIWKVINEAGQISTPLVGTSVGDLLDQMRTELPETYWAPKWKHLLTYVVGAHLDEDDPIGFLLRLGGTRDVVLPAVCYDPTFARPGHR